MTANLESQTVRLTFLKSYGVELLDTRQFITASLEVEQENIFGFRLIVKRLALPKKLNDRPFSVRKQISPETKYHSRTI